MNIRNAYSFKLFNIAASLIVVAMIAAACGSDETATITPVDQTQTTTTVTESDVTVPVRGEHPCDLGEGQIEGEYCLVDGQWWFNAGAGNWVESDGPPVTATTTTVVDAEPDVSEAVLSVEDSIAVEVPFVHVVEPPDSTVPAATTAAPAVTPTPEPEPTPTESVPVPTTTTEPAPTTTTTEPAPTTTTEPSVVPTTTTQPEPSRLPTLTGRRVVLTENTDEEYVNAAGSISRRTVPLRLNVGDVFYYAENTEWQLILARLVDARDEFVRVCTGDDCEERSTGDLWQLYACTRDNTGGHVFDAWKDTDGRFRVELYNSGYDNDIC